MFKRFIFLLALGIVGWEFVELTWPLIDPDGEVTQGAYRGIKVGDTKSEVLTKLRSWTNRIRFDGYYIEDELFLTPSLDPQAESPPPFSLSKKWLLIYPSVHKEVIALTFQDDHLVSIKYHRNAIAP
jgi:hypothetical protein